MADLEQARRRNTVRLQIVFGAGTRESFVEKHAAGPHAVGVAAYDKTGYEQLWLLISSQLGEALLGNQARIPLRDPSHTDRPRMIKPAFEGRKWWLAR